MSRHRPEYASTPQALADLMGGDWVLVEARMQVCDWLKLENHCRICSVRGYGWCPWGALIGMLSGHLKHPRLNWRDWDGP